VTGLDPRTDDAMLQAAQLREIIEAAPHGIVLLDLEGLVLDLNPAMERLLDFTRDEILGNPCGPFTHPDDHEAEWPLLEAVLQGASDGYTMEKRYVRRSGDTVWARLELRLIRDADARPLRLLALIEDISERRRLDDEQQRLTAQLQAHASTLERRLAELAEAQRVAHIGSFEWDVAQDRVSWSDELYRIYGLDPATFTASFETFVANIHPDDRARVTATIQHAVETGERFAMQERIVRPSGEIRHLSSWGEVVRDAHGRPVRLVGICHDVTIERRRRERADALHRAMDALAQSLDLDAVLGVLIDALAGSVPSTSAAVLLCDDAGVLAVGAARGHDGLDDARLASVGEHPGVRAVLDEGATVVGGDAAPESSTPPPLGGEGVRSWLAVPLRAAGEVIGVCSHESTQPDGLGDEDVEWAEALVGQAAAAVANARLHERLRRHAAELEQRVAERTRDLRDAMEEAERANRAKSDFLTGISHELRTPMNAILGFAQLLELDELPAEQSDSVQQILRAGRHLLELISDLLDIARIEAGDLALSLEPVGVEDLVTEAVDLTRPAADRAGVAISILGDGRPYMLADRQRARQVLLNLLSNAVKYNRRGGTVEVSCSSGEAAVAIAVRDTGPGIAPEHVERLFVPFDRLGHEGGVVEGAGLGLALAHRLVDAMGGTIAVESAPGAGSTFTFRLPAAEDPLAALEGAPDPAEPVSTRPATVLYVEDNLANLRLVERALARRPELEVLTATRGQHGLELARERRPDLVLLDLHLPDLPGEEVLDALTSAPETAGIPVVVVSAAASRGRVTRLRERGACDYLTKPIDLGELLAAVDRALGAA
jgi:PAS domain S-box-containing protein